MDWIGDAFDALQGLLDSASVIAIAISLVVMAVLGIATLIDAIRR